MNQAVEETIFSLSSSPPSQSDRRDQSRHLTILRVATLLVDEQRELCLVRNISVGGLMAHVYSQFSPDQRVATEFKSGELIPGRVAWYEDANIGIAFDTPIDVEQMLAAPAQRADGQKPRLPRVEVDKLATLRAGARLYGVNTRDISQGGVKLEVDEPLAAGTNVVLTLDGFRPLAGTVRWCHEGICGVQFNAVVPFKELISWLRGERQVF